MHQHASETDIQMAAGRDIWLWKQWDEEQSGPCGFVVSVHQNIAWPFSWDILHVVCIPLTFSDCRRKRSVSLLRLMFGIYTLPRRFFFILCTLWDAVSRPPYVLFFWTCRPHTGWTQLLKNQLQLPHVSFISWFLFFGCTQQKHTQTHSPSTSTPTPMDISCVLWYCTNHPGLCFPSSSWLAKWQLHSKISNQL